MTNSNLTTYLNDHLAGSVAGLDLLDNLCDQLKGTEFESQIKSIRSEISSDRDALELQMTRLDISESSIRKAFGWIAEKAAELKLLIDDPGSGPFATFEALEALLLGIGGKRSLWATLSSISDTDPHIGRAECEQLVSRSESQLRRVETMRIWAAKTSLGTADQ